MSVNVTAIIKSLPGKSEEMKAVLLELVAGSTQEAACIQYDLHQAADEPNVFIFHEIWQDVEKLQQHNITAHVLKFKEDAALLLAETPAIYITDRI
ncbi:antibiotic biosynthesis monooxygenase [Flavobacterium psychrophilum]|nr:antibiotic biosynthesis monooxygenase [Flavobacterium psychrophilum]AOE51630.1 antibiotic biosynthesis monooxygenase [Flavobacterium psychrophilum]